MKKFFKWLGIIVGIIILIPIISGIVTMSSMDMEVIESQIDSTTIVELNKTLLEARSDSWTAQHLLLFNKRKPAQLKEKVSEPIMIRGEVLAAKSSFVYFGVNENDNMVVEFKSSEDYDKIKRGQNVILKGTFTTGSLPKLVDAEIIDTILIKKQIKELL